MELRGHVNNGMIQPDEPLSLPDGTAVEFHVIESEGLNTNGQSQTSIDELRKVNERFRTARTLDEKRRPQGVRRPNSLADLGGAWPDDGDSVDEFLARVRESRR